MDEGRFPPGTLLAQRYRLASLLGRAGSRMRAGMCVRNEDQATKDRHDREALVASLRDALSHGDKSLVGDKG